MCYCYSSLYIWKPELSKLFLHIHCKQIKSLLSTNNKFQCYTPTKIKGSTLTDTATGVSSVSPWHLLGQVIIRWGTIFLPHHISFPENYENDPVAILWSWADSLEEHPANAADPTLITGLAGKHTTTKSPKLYMSIL